MGKTLVIAEKPDVARKLLQSSRFKNMVKKQGSKPYFGYFENEKYVVTWARGHLLEVMTPGEQDEALKEFRFDNLPIILPVRYKPISSSLEQLKIVLSLIKRSDVVEIVNACDCDKEGELLFREIYELHKTSKPLKRLWLSNYEISEIEAAFNRLLDGEKFECFADSARARQYLDYLIGDTLTRASTVRFAKNRFLLSGGRVQIVLLHEIRKREREVENFQSKTFYNLFADTGFLSQYITEEEYILDPAPLDQLARKLKGTSLMVKDFQQKESSRNAPNLFNATDFLKACIKKLNLTATQAKSVLQDLYQEGLVSYPRTDSRHLPTAMVGNIQEVVEALDNHSDYKQYVEKIEKTKITEKHRSFNDEKVSSHYAIVPTKKPFPEGKKEIEKLVYDLITKRFLSIFANAAKYSVREVVLVDSEGNEFVSKEKVLIEKGYLEILHEEATEDEEEVVKSHFSIPDTSVGELFLVNNCLIKTGQTRKPSYHTVPSILTFMETAGRNLVEEEEIRELLKGKRIGTPATAESFIPKLIERGYIIEEKGKLQTTALGATFIESLPVEDLKNPTFTAEMEESITKIEQNKLSYEEFKKEIIEFAHKIVRQMDATPEEITLAFEKARNNDIEVCECSCNEGKIVDKGKYYGCTAYPTCNIRVPKRVRDKEISAKQIANLILNGETDVIKGFKDEKGSTFEACLALIEGQLKFKKAIFGQCPKCGQGEIRKNKTQDNKEFYGCSNYQNGCTFSIPSVLKEKKLPEAQIKKLLQQRTTDFIDGFVKEGKEYRARIVLDEELRLKFAFPTMEDKSVGKCPLCRGNVIQGNTYYLCEHYKKTCTFILSASIGKKRIPVKQIAKLLDRNVTDTIKGFKNQDGTKEFDAKLTYDTKEQRLKYVFENKKQAKR